MTDKMETECPDCGSRVRFTLDDVAKQRTVRWDRFGRPATLPKYNAASFPTVWWWDAAKASKVGSRS